MFPMQAEMSRLVQSLRPVLQQAPLRLVQLVGSSLRAKFILLIVLLEIVVMGTVTVVVDNHQRRAILEQTQRRALSLGTSMAALNEGYLFSYNFVKLEQTSEHVTKSEVDVVYAIAHIRDGRIAAFSGRTNLQGKTLEDPVSQRALAAETPLVQDITLAQSGDPGYDVA